MINEINIARHNSKQGIQSNHTMNIDTFCVSFEDMSTELTLWVDQNSQFNLLRDETFFLGNKTDAKLRRITYVFNQRPSSET